MKVKMPEYLRITGTSLLTAGYSQDEGCFTLMVNKNASLTNLSIEALNTSYITSDVSISNYTSLIKEFQIKYNVSRYKTNDPTVLEYSGTSGITISHIKNGVGRYHTEVGKFDISILSATYINGEFSSSTTVHHIFTDTTFTTHSIKAFSIEGLSYDAPLSLGDSLPKSNMTSLGTSDDKFYKGYFNDCYSDKFHGFLETLYASEELGALYVLNIVVNRSTASLSVVVDILPRGTYLCDGKIVRNEADSSSYTVDVIAQAKMSPTTVVEEKHHFYILQRVHFTIASGQTASSTNANILAVYAGVARRTPLL